MLGVGFVRAKMRSTLIIAVLAGVTIFAVVASGDPGPRPAKADNATVNCSASNSLGTNLVFSDGSNLFDTMAVIRCLLNADFGVLTLEKGERHTCYDKQGRNELVVYGYSSSVIACSSGQIVVPAVAAQELYKLSHEMRWFMLAAAAIGKSSGSDGLSTRLCIGGFVVASQPVLDTTRLIADVRAKKTSESDIDMILVGIMLALNYQSVATCAEPPQPWHNPNAEVVPFAAGPGSNPGASAPPPNEKLFQKMNTQPSQNTGVTLVQVRNVRIFIFCELIP